MSAAHISRKLDVFITTTSLSKRKLRSIEEIPFQRPNYDELYRQLAHANTGKKPEDRILSRLDTWISYDNESSSAKNYEGISTVSWADETSQEAEIIRSTHEDDVFTPRRSNKSIEKELTAVKLSPSKSFSEIRTSRSYAIDVNGNSTTGAAERKLRRRSKTKEKEKKSKPKVGDSFSMFEYGSESRSLESEGTPEDYGRVVMRFGTFSKRQFKLLFSRGNNETPVEGGSLKKDGGSLKGSDKPLLANDDNYDSTRKSSSSWSKKFLSKTPGKTKSVNLNGLDSKQKQEKKRHPFRRSKSLSSAKTSYFVQTETVTFADNDVKSECPGAYRQLNFTERLKGMPIFYSPGKSHCKKTDV